MRNPVRSESDAYHLVLIAIGLFAASVVVGVLISIVAGVIAFGVLIVIAVAWVLISKDPNPRQPLREAAEAGERRNTPHAGKHVLVVANRTLLGNELLAEIGGRPHDTELTIVAPILSSRLHYVTTDVDRELADANLRLNEALAWANANSFRASGKVGDPNAALDAIEDELRLTNPDEIVIATHPAGKSNWLETGIVDRLQSELAIPVTHVVVQPAA